MFSGLTVELEFIHIRKVASTCVYQQKTWLYLEKLLYFPVMHVVDQPHSM